MANEQKNKKVKKYTNKPLVVLVIVAIVAVVTMYWVINRGKKDTKQSVAAPVQEAQAEEKSLIDLSKTENVKIENNEKENTSEEMKKEKTYEGMTIKDIQLKTIEGMTQFTAKVENNSGKNYAGGKIVIRFTDKDGKEYALLNGVIPSIANGETNSINAGTTEDVANAYDFSIQASK